MVQDHAEFTSPADFALHGNAPVVQLRNALANGKPDPEAGQLGGVRRPEKRVENVRQIVFADPYALVADLYKAFPIVR